MKGKYRRQRRPTTMGYLKDVGFFVVFTSHFRTGDRAKVRQSNDIILMIHHGISIPPYYD